MGLFTEKKFPPTQFSVFAFKNLSLVFDLQKFQVMYASLNLQKFLAEVRYGNTQR